MPGDMIQFPGIGQAIEASYVLGHGVSPGTVSLTILPQAAIEALVGDLVFSFDGVDLVFPDCKVDYHSFEFTPSGFVWRLTLLDHRWRWRYGEPISGRYNVSRTDEVRTIIDLWTEKTPQELATLCLKAMGEQRFDLGELPNDARPFVDWDRDNAAAMLASLCDTLGCRVVWTLDAGVKICRAGFGSALPNLPSIIQTSEGFQVTTRPDAVRVVCGPTRFQADMLLEAVGLDTDGLYKPLDKLSYTPANGWTSCPPPFFANLTPASREQALAKATVFRTYRIPVRPLGLKGKPLKLPGSQREIVSRVEILPIEDVQCETFINTDVLPIANANGIRDTPVPTSKPAMIWGLFWSRTSGLGYQDNLSSLDLAMGADIPAPFTPGAEYKGGFTIDTEEGIVHFNEYVYRFDLREEDDGYDVVPAALALRTAVSYHDLHTRAVTRYEKDLPFPGAPLGTGVKVLRHEEIRKKLYNLLSPTDLTVREVVDNLDIVDPQVDYYLDHALIEYQIPEPADALYAGLIPISPDGAIQQVSWSIGPQGITTRASRNTEHSYYVIPFKEKRFLEQQQQLQADKEKEKKV